MFAEAHDCTDSNIQKNILLVGSQYHTERVLAPESRGLAQLSVVTTWMGDHFVLGCMC